MAIERVVLVGFMASGKSVVGKALARRLGWRCVDLDEEIERLAARSIAEIFAHDGEAEFRRIEMEATRGTIGAKGLVLSCGGGWVTNPESFQLVPRDSLIVWLRVSPETAVARVRAHVDGAVRPLLANDDPIGTAVRLLREREALYQRADLTVDSDVRGVEDIVREIEAHVRDSATAPLASPFNKAHADQG